MNVLQTVAVFVGAPLAIYALIGALSMLPGRSKRRPKYRAGEPWNYPDQWWAGDYPVPAAEQALVVAGTEGGARGTW